MKRVEDRWSELDAGESVLTDHPPDRQVSCVSLVIKRGRKQLIEVRQVLANGETRRRFQPPAEKVLRCEDPEPAFSTPEAAGRGDTAVAMHHWEWCGSWRQ